MPAAQVTYEGDAYAATGSAQDANNVEVMDAQYLNSGSNPYQEEPVAE